MEFVELVGIIETERIENAKKFMRSQSATSVRTMSSRSSLMSIDSSDDIIVEEVADTQIESTSKGKVQGSMVLNYFTAGVKWPALMAVLFSFLFAQIIGSTFDYQISIW